MARAKIQQVRLFGLKELLGAAVFLVLIVIVLMLVLQLLVLLLPILLLFGLITLIIALLTKKKRKIYGKMWVGKV